MDLEGLIIGLLIMAASALFGQKKSAEATEKRLGKTPEMPRKRGMKRAEDYAKELYGEFQAQMKDQPEKAKQVTRRVQETVDRSPVARKAQEKATRKVKETVNQSPLMDTSREISAQEPISRIGSGSSRMGSERSLRPAADSMFPLEKEDLKKSIILAEILMPPKSKR